MDVLQYLFSCILEMLNTDFNLLGYSFSLSSVFLFIVVGIILIEIFNYFS